MSYHSYYSSSELSSSSSSNVRLAPQTTARIAREVRELIVTPESGVYLVVDEATGLPHSLQELTVRLWLLDTPEYVCICCGRWLKYRVLIVISNMYLCFRLNTVEKLLSTERQIR